MKKVIAISIILLAQAIICSAQDQWIVDIKQKLAAAIHDSSRSLELAELANYYKLKKPDSALYYAYKALELARKINFPAGEAKAIQQKGKDLPS